MKSRILLTSTVAFLIVLFSSASAITISPGIVNAGDLDRGKAYSYDIYMTNQDSESVSVALEITRRSSYMEKFANISPKDISLNPGETKKVRILLNLPNESSEMENGTHHLTILPGILTGNGAGVKIISMPIIQLIFTIPGTVTESMSLESFSAPDAKIGDIMTFELLAGNTGNVRTVAFPFVEIQRYGSIIGLSEGYTEYIVAPEKQVKLFTKYSTLGMEPGKYRAIAYIEYAGKKKTNTIEKTFSILPPAKKTDPHEEKDAAAPVHSIPPKGYISIGGEKTPISLDSDSDKPINYESETSTTDSLGEIIARNLSLEQSGNSLAIILVLENTHGTGLEYDAVFNIFSGDGTKEGTIITRSYLNKLETAEIRKTWNISGNGYGNYTITAEITYEIEGRVETVKKTSSVEIKRPANSITGNILGAAVSEKIPAVLAIVLFISACAIIIISGGKRRQKENKQNAGAKSAEIRPLPANDLERLKKQLASSGKNIGQEKEHEKTS